MYICEKVERIGYSFAEQCMHASFFCLKQIITKTLSVFSAFPSAIEGSLYATG